MLEVFMSVWPNHLSASPCLETSEGALISVSVSVEPRFLEELLEALAGLNFPINPQIYHDAALRYVYPDGREDLVPTTLVDFPAYADRLPEIRRVLEAYNFAPDSLQVTGMLDDIHASGQTVEKDETSLVPRVQRLRHAHASASH
jgi:hypothetical protein